MKLVDFPAVCVSLEGLNTVNTDFFSTISINPKYVTDIAEHPFTVDKLKSDLSQITVNQGGATYVYTIDLPRDAVKERLLNA